MDHGYAGLSAHSKREKIQNEKHENQLKFQKKNENGKNIVKEWKPDQKFKKK